jgi:hypothetical protein
LIIAETTKSWKEGYLILEMKYKNKALIYSDEERGDFTFIEAREL